MVWTKPSQRLWQHVFANKAPLKGELVDENSRRKLEEIARILPSDHHLRLAAIVHEADSSLAGEVAVLTHKRIVHINSNCIRLVLEPGHILRLQHTMSTSAVQRTQRSPEAQHVDSALEKLCPSLGEASFAPPAMSYHEKALGEREQANKRERERERERERASSDTCDDDDDDDDGDDALVRGLRTAEKTPAPREWPSASPKCRCAHRDAQYAAQSGVQAAC
jgi:hypothetical protein